MNVTISSTNKNSGKIPMDNFQYIVYVYSMIQDTSYSTLMNND